MDDKKIIIHEVKNSGLIHADPSVQNYHAPKYFGIAKQNIVGTISPLKPPPTIFPTGYGWLKVWQDYDNPEIQFNRKFDTFSCVIFTIAKATCLYMFKVYGIRITIAEMYNAFYAEVKRVQGTTIEKGMQSFKNYGWGSDEDYPFTADTTIDEFFRRPPETIRLKFKGVLTEWDFHWEVLPKDLKAIFEAYKKTPVVLTGFAWAAYYGEGVYYDYNNQANHAFLGLEPSSVKLNNLISDTYPKDFIYQDKNELDSDELIKELDRSFKYGSAHRCWVTPKKESVSLFTKIKNMINDIWVWFETVGSPKGLRAYYVPKDAQGKPKGKQELKFDTLEQIIISVKALFAAFFASNLFKKTSWPEVKDLEDKKFI